MTLTPADIAAIVDGITPRLVTATAAEVIAHLKAAGVTPSTQPEADPLPIAMKQTELARRLGCSPSTICRKIQSGEIKVNGAGMIPVSEARRFIDATRRRKVRA